jgi:hypothetical protein
MVKSAVCFYSLTAVCTVLKLQLAGPGVEANTKKGEQESHVFASLDVHWLGWQVM